MLYCCRCFGNNEPMEQTNFPTMRAKYFFWSLSKNRNLTQIWSQPWPPPPSSANTACSHCLPEQEPGLAVSSCLHLSVTVLVTVPWLYPDCTLTLSWPCPDCILTQFWGICEWWRNDEVLNGEETEEGHLPGVWGIAGEVLDGLNV